MAVFSRIKTWVSNEVLTAADLNAEFNNILNNMDPEGIEDASATVADMQSSVNPGGVGTESLATDLLGEIKRLRYVVQRLVGTYWYSDPGRYLTAGGLNVQAADIAAGAVTQAKRAALGQQVSSSCGSFSTTSSSYVDVTNLSVSITTTGRPVSILLQPDGSVNTDSSYIRSATEASNSGGLYIRILRGSTVVSQTKLKGDVAATSLEWPPTSISFIDIPSAGTYVYKIQLRASGTGAVLITYSVLVAYEL